MNTNANEPAYPFTPTDKSGQIGPSAPGITKREAAAIAAMQGCLSNAAFLEYCSTTATKQGYDTPEILAGVAVLYADALLLELSKPTP